MRILHVTLVSVMESVENDQREHRRKFDPEELKQLVGKANNHFKKPQHQNLNTTGGSV